MSKDKSPSIPKITGEKIVPMHDTVIAFDGHVIGKPITEGEAKIIQKWLLGSWGLIQDYFQDRLIKRHTDFEMWENFLEIYLDQEIDFVVYRGTKEKYAYIEVECEGEKALVLRINFDQKKLKFVGTEIVEAKGE